MTSLALMYSPQDNEIPPEKTEVTDALYTTSDISFWNNFFHSEI